MLRIVIAIAVGLALGIAAPFGVAASAKTPAKVAKAAAKPAAHKAGPACARLTFRALPAGQPDGEQTAGTYSSRLAKLALRATVKGGAAVDYYVVAGGNRLAAAPASLPQAAESCTAAKKLPKPEAAAQPCTGERFSLLIAHVGGANGRIALLYGLDGTTWHYCAAGTF